MRLGRGLWLRLRVLRLGLALLGHRGSAWDLANETTGFNNYLLKDVFI